MKRRQSNFSFQNSSFDFGLLFGLVRLGWFAARDSFMVAKHSFSLLDEEPCRGISVS